MKITTIILSICAIALNSCAPSSGKVKTKFKDGARPTLVKSNLKSLERQTASTVNSKRVSMGKQSVSYLEGMADVARDHSEYLIKQYAKTGVKDPNHNRIRSRVSKLALKHSMGKTGENVAFIHTSNGNKAGYMLQMWMDSPSHRKNLLSEWNYTGVGAAQASDGTLFVTQLFGLKTDFTF